MKRYNVLFLMLFLITAMLTTDSFAEPVKEIHLYLDDQKLASESAPYIDAKANVTMVPLRIISENLGAAVKWTQASRTVDIYQEDSHISMTVGSPYAVIDGDPVKLAASVQLHKNKTMVPIRMIAETFGIQVSWNSATRSVQLWSDDKVYKEVEVRPEMRGAWISSVFNLDWPSDDSYGDAPKQKQQFEELLDELLEMGLNTVFVQVRPAGDALYPSMLVPWSKYLTGTQGEDPGYDPLAFMIEAAHDRGMEFHAWFNPFRASTDNKRTDLASKHVVHKHPDWIVEADKKLFIDPGIPAARQHIIDTILEVVNQYNIDGVHLDDYFYPSRVVFPDEASFSAYNPTNFIRAEWRRNNINDFVQQLGAAIKDSKPKVQFGISPFGVWRNQNVDSTGSDTQASVSTYDQMYADVRTWIQQEWIDYVMPQLYWSMSFEVARYDKLVDWWVQEVTGTNVDLYIGHSPYKIGTQESGWHTAQEIINQLNYNKRYPQIKGDVYFSAKDLRRNPLGIVDLLREYYH